MNYWEQISDINYQISIIRYQLSGSVAVFYFKAFGWDLIDISHQVVIFKLM